MIGLWAAESRRALFGLLPLALLWSALAMAAPAWANEGAGVSGVALTPVLVERDLGGHNVSLDFAVANNETHAVRVQLSVVELHHSDDGTPGYGAPVTGVAVTPTELLLEPGQRSTVVVRGAVPLDQAALYAALLAEPVRVGGGDHGAVQIRTRVAALLLLQADPDAAKAVDIAELRLEAAGQLGTSATVQRVLARVRNTGALHVRPHGVARISTMDGRELASWAVGGNVLLPGSSRLFDIAQWTPPANPPRQVRLSLSLREPTAERDVIIDLWELLRAGEIATGGDAGAGGAGGAGGALGLPALSGGQLHELGGGPGLFGRGGLWLVWFAFALLILMTALLIWQRDHLRPAQ